MIETSSTEKYNLKHDEKFIRNDGNWFLKALWLRNSTKPNITLKKLNFVSGSQNLDIKSDLKIVGWEIQP